MCKNLDVNMYRIKKVGKDIFYPQVANKTSLYNKLVWQRIGKHADGGFGLYSDEDHHLTSEEEALNVIKNYKHWLSNKDGVVTYIYLNI